jgi:hypothetical protein
MKPPPGHAVYKKFRLVTGVWHRPDLLNGGQLTLRHEADALQLEREGWTKIT